MLAWDLVFTKQLQRRVFFMWDVDNDSFQERHVFYTSVFLFFLEQALPDCKHKSVESFQTVAKYLRFVLVFQITGFAWTNHCKTVLVSKSDYLLFNFFPFLFSQGSQPFCGNQIDQSLLKSYKTGWPNLVTSCYKTLII